MISPSTIRPVEVNLGPKMLCLTGAFLGSKIEEHGEREGITGVAAADAAVHRLGDTAASEEVRLEIADDEAP